MYIINMGGRESSLKLIFYLSVDGMTITNADPAEIEVFLKLKRPKCRRCGAEVRWGDLGYLGIWRRREVYYCSKCVGELYEKIYAAVEYITGSCIYSDEIKGCRY